MEYADSGGTWSCPSPTVRTLVCSLYVIKIFFFVRNLTVIFSKCDKGISMKAVSHLLCIVISNQPIFSWMRSL